VFTGLERGSRFVRGIGQPIMTRNLLYRHFVCFSEALCVMDSRLYQL